VLEQQARHRFEPLLQGKMENPPWSQRQSTQTVIADEHPPLSRRDQQEQDASPRVEESNRPTKSAQNPEKNTWHSIVMIPANQVIRLKRIYNF
jgi:hypothetical protein